MNHNGQPKANKTDADSGSEASVASATPPSRRRLIKSISRLEHMNSNTSPWTIKQRCTADWEQMRGDDKRRFCEHCQCHVHNVSAMTRAEREDFARPENMQECVFYSQRSDGEVADLSFLVRLRRMFPFLRFVYWSALVGLLPVTLTGCMGVRCPRPGEVRSIQPETSQETTKQTSTVKSTR